MIVPVPAQYETELHNRWQAYQGALQLGTASLITTTRTVLNMTLDKCSTALGRPKTPRPSVVEQGDSLALEYPS
jgi:hypothetical protein